MKFDDMKNEIRNPPFRIFENFDQILSAYQPLVRLLLLGASSTQGGSSNVLKINAFGEDFSGKIRTLN